MIRICQGRLEDFDFMKDENTLPGGIGDDLLNGGAGNDTRVGGEGNDTCWVDSAGDVAVRSLCIFHRCADFLIVCCGSLLPKSEINPYYSF
jgi:hypothetical protein